jgi:hypothetical protein
VARYAVVNGIWGLASGVVRTLQQAPQDLSRSQLVERYPMLRGQVTCGRNFAPVRILDWVGEALSGILL